MKNNVKNCPIYILPHWSNFKEAVKEEVDKLNGVKKEEPIYYIVKIGKEEKKFTTLDEAKKNCPEGSSVYYQNKVVYTNEPKQPAKPAVNVYYRSYVDNRWLSEIVNYNNENTKGYSGITKRYIRGYVVKSSVGKVAYRAHVKNGGWLNWITQYNINDWSKGVSGLRTQIIDAIQLELTGAPGYKIEYRVSTTDRKDYLPWVEGTKDYAGIYGKPIDQIQIRIVGAD